MQADRLAQLDPVALRVGAVAFDDPAARADDIRLNRKTWQQQKDMKRTHVAIVSWRRRLTKPVSCLITSA
jgi:hypothetical protein